MEKKKVFDVIYYYLIVFIIIIKKKKKKKKKNKKKKYEYIYISYISIWDLNQRSISSTIPYFVGIAEFLTNGNTINFVDI